MFTNLASIILILHCFWNGVTNAVYILQGYVGSGQMAADHSHSCLPESVSTNGKVTVCTMPQSLWIVVAITDLNA